MQKIWSLGALATFNRFASPLILAYATPDATTWHQPEVTLEFEKPKLDDQVATNIGHGRCDRMAAERPVLVTQEAFRIAWPNDSSWVSADGSNQQDR